MYEISIKDNCISCGKCVTVCPVEIFRMTSDSEKATKKTIEVVHPSSCIDCSHCVCVCPVEAIEHSSFPEGSLRDVEYDKYPSPEQVLELIEGRRSNRAFTKEPIQMEKLNLLKRAALKAPTASNTRKIDCMIITDPEQLKAVTRFTVDKFYSLAKILNLPVIRSIARKFVGEEIIKTAFRMDEDLKNGKDDILRGATSLILFYSTENTHFKVEDTNLAYQNASLMAESMRLSHFYTGFVCVAIRFDKQKTLQKMLGIKGEIFAGMALGNQKFPMLRTRAK